MHKGNLPQFKRLKAFGQYKNRTAVYNPASIVLHFAVAPVQLSGYPAITKYTPLGAEHSYAIVTHIILFFFMCFPSCLGNRVGENSS